MMSFAFNPNNGAGLQATETTLNPNTSKWSMLYTLYTIAKKTSSSPNDVYSLTFILHLDSTGINAYLVYILLKAK